MTQIKNSSLVWSTEDVYVNMTEEMRNSKEWTEEELLALGEQFFDTHADWLGERINDAMSEFLHFEVDLDVRIGNQLWMRKDLEVIRFRNGDLIPLVQDDKEWAELTTAAYCISPSGGYLYNWYAVNDERGLAPEGWHVPTDEEWTTLTDHLGGENVAGVKMKSSTPTWNGNNSSGFSALSGSLRYSFSGDFSNERDGNCWWTASPSGTSYAWNRYLYSEDNDVSRHSNNQRYGFSVRCLRDEI